MKGKLIKCNHFYTLQIESDIIAVSLEKETEVHTVNYEHSLSKQNCQAIENGYDLDELSKEETRKFLGHDVPENIMLFIAHSKMFQKGFQTALELVEHRLFKETEWQVEVVLDRIPADLAPGGWDVFPKLDAENCLILKRVE